MKKEALLVLTIILALSSLISGQTPTPTPQETPKGGDDSEVLRVTTNLIQIDAVVTDKQDRVVTDLKPEDFEILVNGKPQLITNFSLVMLAPQPGEQQQQARAKNTGPTTLPLPPVRLRPEQVKRTLALVVDDLSLSLASASSVRKALRKFVAEQMQPGDLIAIIRVGSGIGRLQQFTSDKEELYAAVEQMKYNPVVGRAGAFLPFGAESFAGQGGFITQSSDLVNGGGMVDLGNVSLTITNHIVRGMRNLPGRKAVMLLSEGFSISNSGIREGIKLVVDSAQRSGVVIYTMDPRGLETLGLSAADHIGLSPQQEAAALARGDRVNMSDQQLQSALNGRRLQLLETQDSLIYLAKEAGGFAIYNNNDLSSGIRKTLDDQKSYYLIGYQPDESVFDPVKSRFNQLTIKVKKPGLKVRYRSGFFGIKDEEMRAKPGASTPQQQIMGALISPFGSGDISLRLTPLFANDAKAGSFLRSLVHISTKDLTFTDNPDGSHQATINVVAYTFGDNSIIADSVGETHTITLTDQMYKRALSSGLVYSLNVPIKRAGGYQLRVAVRDDKSQKVGTASQFIKVPNLRDKKLALSGIALSSYDPKDEKNSPSEAAQSSSASAPINMVLTQGTLRRFQTGHVLQFAYAIYNAKIDVATGQPRLTTQLMLVQDGKVIYAGKETPYDPKGQLDLERLLAQGGLQLTGIKEGDYILQIVVRDNLATDKNRVTTGWIDFEVTK